MGRVRHRKKGPKPIGRTPGDAGAAAASTGWAAVLGVAARLSRPSYACSHVHAVCCWHGGDTGDTEPAYHS